MKTWSLSCVMTARAVGCENNKAELTFKLQEWAKGLLKELLLWVENGAEWKERPGGQSCKPIRLSWNNRRTPALPPRPS